MTTENLYWVLSPDAYAALREGFKRRAEQERRDAIDRFGTTGWTQLLAHGRQSLRQHSPIQPRKA